MQKFPLLLSIFFLSLTLITGCTQSGSNTQSESTANTNQSSANSSNEGIATAEVKDAIKAAEDYKKAEYEINASEDILSTESLEKRKEVLKPYLTEKFYESQSKTRKTILPLTVSDNQKASLKPENLQFNLEEQKEDTVALNYTLDLLLLDHEGKESKRIPLEGVLTLVHVNEQWLIQSDTFDENTFKDLIL